MILKEKKKDLRKRKKEEINNKRTKNKMLLKRKNEAKKKKYYQKSKFVILKWKPKEFFKIIIHSIQSPWATQCSRLMHVKGGIK